MKKNWTQFGLFYYFLWFFQMNKIIWNNMENGGKMKQFKLIQQMHNQGSNTRIHSQWRSSETLRFTKWVGSHINSQQHAWPVKRAKANGNDMQAYTWKPHRQTLGNTQRRRRWAPVVFSGRLRRRSNKIFPEFIKSHTKRKVLPCTVQIYIQNKLIPHESSRSSKNFF